MNKYYIPLEPEKYYHIYNHAVGRINIFENEGNYYYFLEKYRQYVSPYVDTFAYCLLPNHFHLAVRVKDLTGFKNLSGLVTEVISWFQDKKGFMEFHKRELDDKMIIEFE